LKERFDDPYVLKVSEMSDSRIGGQIGYVRSVMKDPIMSHHNENLPDKLVDGVILKAARDLFNSLNEKTKPVLAEFFEVSSEDLTPYHLTVAVETEMAGIMINDYGIKSHVEYVQKNGFDDFIAFILAVGKNLIKQLPKS
jgi:hypothetical protein